MTATDPARPATGAAPAAGGEGPLAPLHGARPAAPAWFTSALAHPVERDRVDVDGAGIETLAWGQRGKPGLLLLHGNGAHAHWWSFLAPFWADHYRVAALSWSGMGGSDWRERYTIPGFVNEAMAVAEATGMFDGPTKPVVLGHSFGGFPTLAVAGVHGARLAAAITLDSPINRPDRPEDRPPERAKPNRVYATETEALARFRLAPPQGCDNLFAIDHIARHSLIQTPGGVTWRFDPFLWRNFDHGDSRPLLSQPGCPIAILWGAQSRLMGPDVIAHMRALAPAGTPFVEIPEAEHHVLLDQPLALVSAVRALLDGWAHRPGGP